MTDPREMEQEPKPAAEQVGEQVGAQAERARQQATEALEEHKGALAREMSNIARAMHAAHDTLEQQGDPLAASYADRAASAAEQLAGTVERKPLSEVARDVQDFARREPAITAGVAALVGFFGARFLRASPERRPEERAQAQEQTPATATVPEQATRSSQ